MGQRIATVEVPPRLLDGQEWPVVNVVEQLGAGEWLVVLGLCDGLPAEVRKYHSEEEALRAIGAPSPGVWRSEEGRVTLVTDSP